MMFVNRRVQSTGCARTAGFTLLEVLIALAIFAICAAVLIRHNAQATDSEYQLEMKTRAGWLAADRLNAVRIANQWPSPGITTDSTTVAEEPWTITVEIAETLDPDLLRVEVSVATAKQPDYRLAQLAGFIGRH